MYDMTQMMRRCNVSFAGMITFGLSSLAPQVTIVTHCNTLEHTATQTASRTATHTANDNAKIRFMA